MAKRLTIEYQDTWTDISVPDNASVLEYGAAAFPPIAIHPHPETAVRKALHHPIGMERLDDLVRGGSKVTIAFDDPIKHPEAIKIIIPIVVEELIGLGVKEEDITLLCASGAHCKLRPNEFRTLLGRSLYNRFRSTDWDEGRIRNHDCTQGTVYLGETALGDRVEYNRVVMDADQLIYVGTVYPLPYGGYGGQGAVIGLAGIQALKSLHSYDVFRSEASLHGDYRPERNLYRKHKLAVHHTMEEATGKKIFYVDALTGPQQKIINVFAGHVPELEKAEYPEGDTYFRVKVPEVDVIVVGLPYTLDYDTSDHPASACNYAARPARGWWNRPVLRKNGVVIALGRCMGAISPRRPGDAEALRLYRDCFSTRELYDYMEAFCNNPDYLYKYRYEYAYSAMHSIFMIANIEIMQKVARHTIFAGEVNPGLVREIGALPAENFDQAMQMATELVGSHPDMLVLPRYLRDPKPIFEVI